MKYLIFFALFALGSAQTEERRYPVFDRPCSERSAIVRPQVKTAFNVAAYSGTWFEVERYQQRDEPEADCVASSYTWRFLSREFTITRTGQDFVNNQPFSREATAVLAFPGASNTEQVGLLNVTYYADRVADETNYYILATDYFQYAIGWGCEDLEDNQSREYAWIISRTPSLPEAYLERIEAYKDRFFDRDFLRATAQEDSLCLSQAPEIPETETTEAPETETPEATGEPETEDPETETPEATGEPETEDPETETPEATDEPETEDPETEAPEITETEEPETESPNTDEPEIPEGRRFPRRWMITL